jgi:septum formation protein
MTMSASPPPAPASQLRLILASASPRRQELLAQLGLPFTVSPAAIEEHSLPDEPPRSYALRMARTKAHTVAQRFPEAIVLGADTIVVLEHHILGKPGSVAAARQMLTRLSHREHLVITGIAVHHRARQWLQCQAVQTTVRFRRLSSAQIESYLQTGEPFDKAGAYAIQGQAAAFVEHLQGCYTNVVGLPLRCTATLLRAAGLTVPTPPGHNARNAW